MSEELLFTRVRSQTSDVPGRSLNEARERKFVIGEPVYAGGTGDEISPGEAFLGGISACGVMMLERRARETGVSLRHAQASIEGTRLASDTSWYTAIDLRFRLAGPSQEEAETLVAHYQSR
jgi:uncharacterized OsmC-like protein